MIEITCPNCSSKMKTRSTKNTLHTTCIICLTKIEALVEEGEVIEVHREWN